jgi:hypothetical protein
MKMDADEKELLECVERGNWKSANGGRERARYSRYAKATFRNYRRLPCLPKDAATLCEPQLRTMRHQRPGISMPFRECAQSPRVLIVRSGDFRAEFDEGEGLKNRYTCERKSWIRQVLSSRTLSVCGEVAERLKAAVC